MPTHNKTDTALLQNEKEQKKKKKIKQTNKNQGEKAQVFIILNLFPWENSPWFCEQVFQMFYDSNSVLK